MTKAIGRKSVPSRSKNNYDSCLLEAKKYTSFYDYKQKDKYSYIHAKAKGWCIDYTWLDGHPACDITKEEFFDLARQFTKHKRFMKLYPKENWVAQKNGWIDECDWWYKQITWTKELAAEFAKTCTSPTDLRNKKNHLYEVCRKNKWLGEFFPPKNNYG